jgi:hypothetical protein
VSPEPLATALQVKRRKIELLIEVWLFVAGLYTRASLFEDAKAAVDEAAELVMMVEGFAVGEGAGLRRGWGGVKSTDELWADVASSVSLLFTYLSNFGRLHSKADKSYSVATSILPKRFHTMPWLTMKRRCHMRLTILPPQSGSPPYSSTSHPQSSHQKPLTHLSTSTPRSHLPPPHIH